MTQINLLPWRAHARQAKKLRFALAISGSVAIAFFATVFMHIIYMHMLANQQARNIFLQSEISQAKIHLADLEKLQDQQVAVTKALQFILGLRNESYQAVNLLDALPRLVPPTIAFNKVIREGNKINIFGRAKSEIEITLFMKSIAKNTIFKQPDLTEISTKGNSTDQERTFQLQVEQQE